MDWEKHLSTILHHTNVNLEKQFSSDPLGEKSRAVTPKSPNIIVDNNKNNKFSSESVRKKHYIVIKLRSFRTHP